MENFIHPTAIIENVTFLGGGNHIGPYCVIKNAVISESNVFTSHVCIGAPPQHISHLQSGKEDRPVIIGSFNNFREFTTVHSGTISGTFIGDHNFLMNYVHIPHDCTVKNNVTIANNAQIAGHTYISSFCNIGLSAVIHQFSFLGEGCMIGMGTVIPKQKRILPYKVYVGAPCKELRDNQYLIDKNQIGEKDLAELRKHYNTEFNKTLK